MSRDSEKGLGFLLGHEEPETKAQRIKEVGDSIKRMTRHTYKDTPVAFDPINLDTPLFTPTVAPQETPKTKPTENEKEARDFWKAYNNKSRKKMVAHVENMKNKYDGPTTKDTVQQLIALRKWAQPEADNINKIKKMAWEESPTKSPAPKKITTQDIINVYKPK